MPSPNAGFLFLGSFALTVISSIVLSRRIEQLGKWLLLSESLLGIIAALGSDMPEISSSVVAMQGGQHDLGLGIVLGSNVFNLAALLGLSALLSGKVKVSRRTLALDGSIAVVVLALTIAQLYRVLAAQWAAGLVAAIMVAYVGVLAVPRAWLRRMANALGFGRELSQTEVDSDKKATTSKAPRRPSYADLLGIVPTLVCIVVGSIGMVRSAVILSGTWGISTTVVGTIILASLTGIPNVITAVQLALRRRGAAVLSESLNSNTLNLIAGVALPALFLGMGPLSARTRIPLAFLVGMTLLSLVLSFFRGGMGRKGGALLVGLYIVFVMIILRAS